ncbi:MAG: SufD family Fe-S cluster assembly protein [Patescibacteria group bacterium]|jgi:Fe-S cluster assembly scaffold protein SufB
MKQVVKFLKPGVKEDIMQEINPQSGIEVLVFFVGKAKEIFKCSTIIKHLGSKTSSKVHMRGVLFEGAQATLVGKVKVESKAKASKTHLEQRVLLVGEEAKAEALPQLEITGSEVKASHKASIGRTNKDALLYLMSRGFSKKEAKALLAESFLEPVLARIHDKKLKKNIEKQIVKTIRSTYV